MTQEEAFQRLKEAGLHVRQLDGGGLIGGSHVDASSGLNMVENSFLVTPESSKYKLQLQGSIESGLTLEETVDLVIQRVTPQANIEAPPRVTRPGEPVLY